MFNEMLASLLVVDCDVRRRTRHAHRDDAYARELRGAVRTLSRGVLGSIASVSIAEPINPDLLVQAYIVSGGDWPSLAAAVNRHGLDAQGRRAS